MDEAYRTTGKKRVAYVVLVRKPEEKRPLGNPSVGSRIILKRIFRKWTRNGFMWPSIGIGDGYL